MVGDVPSVGFLLVGQNFECIRRWLFIRYLVLSVCQFDCQEAVSAACVLLIIICHSRNLWGCHVSLNPGSAGKTVIYSKINF